MPRGSIYLKPNTATTANIRKTPVNPHSTWKRAFESTMNRLHAPKSFLNIDLNKTWHERLMYTIIVQIHGKLTTKSYNYQSQGYLSNEEDYNFHWILNDCYKEFKIGQNWDSSLDWK